MTDGSERRHGPLTVREVALVAALGLGLLLAPGLAAEDIPYPHGDYEEDCSTCHSPQSWHPAVISERFDHGRSSGFTLDGAHRTAMCRSCHLSLDFAQADNRCVSCHLDAHNGELGVDCAQCHSTSNFIDHADQVRSHRTTRFPLDGAHTTLDCLSCHPQQPSGALRFVNTPTECESCHLDAFMRTTEPNHVQLDFDRNCIGCHGTATWNAVRFDSFDHTVTGFPLVGAHRGLDCAQCHVGGNFAGADAECFTCHQPDFESTQSPDHVSGGFPTDCQQCHGAQGWTPAEFDHGLTGFPLTGSHGGLTCEQCHTDGTQTAIDSTCVSCHQVNFDDAPNHVSSNFPQTCEDCHNTVGWGDAIFNHDFFPFVGGHSGLSCAQCHTTGVYESIPADCQSCHQSDYQEAPGHASGGFPTTCDDCHSLNTWADVDFAHDLFPLTDAHDGINCVQCHDGGTFGTIPADCISCHDESYQTAPGHVSSGFSQDCLECHTTTTWVDWTFDHGAFALEGSHGGLTCAQCHTTGVYQTMPSQCVFCHQSDFVEAPSHVASNFPQDCESCHGTNGWGDATFDHSFFPLSGAHNAVQCIACHTSGTYGTIPADCFSCHDNDYQQAAGHPGSFPTTCEDCHSVTAWGDATFDHSFFPLSGAHNAVQCIACHTSGTYGTIPADCFSCHDNDYQQAAGHPGSFPTTCEDCHSVTAWGDATFDHSFFPLSGAHNAVQCIACHTSGTYGTIPADCFSCHDNDYQQAAGHPGSFPTTCEDCHSVTAWGDATFDHSFFPLSGAHNAVQCIACHTSGTYGTIPADCFSCHDNDYQQAAGHPGSFPTTCEDCHSVTAWGDATFDHSFFPLSGAHNAVQCIACHTSGTYGTIPADCFSCHDNDYQQAAGHPGSFPTTCEDCHSVTAWGDATFDHSFFPLSGAHNAVQCITCHTSGTYGTIPADCFSCHTNDYQQAPGHAGAFPTTCEDCHSVTTWGDATFDHSFFPLSGAHNGLQCIACHTSGTYGTIPADCFSCHTNDYQQAPGHVGSFPTTCDDCHTVTIWQNATFDHSIFPLTGGHNAATCQQCHTGGTYGTIPSDCIFCHQADYTEAPSHMASNFSQNCENCHSITVWSNATYDHSFFPLSGGHNGLQCLACHTSGVYATIPADCFSCHQNDYNTAPDHQSLNFPHDCQSCHDPSTWQNTNFFHSFPLSGPHGGRDCNECHISGTTEDFSCYGSCHEHGQSQTDADHRGESGYAYDFQLCLSCHPNGRH